MGLGDIGAGIGKMAEGFTGGMVSGMEKNRMYQMQDRQIKNQEELLKIHKQKAYMEAAFKALEVTPDEHLPKWLEHYNSTAPEMQLPPLAGVQRGKEDYEMTDASGLKWLVSKRGVIKPAMVGGVQLKGKPNTTSVAPDSSVYNLDTGKVDYTAPSKPMVVPSDSTVIDPSQVRGSTAPTTTQPQKFKWGAPGQLLPATGDQQDGRPTPSTAPTAPVQPQPGTPTGPKPGVIFEGTPKAPKPNFEQQTAIDAKKRALGRDDLNPDEIQGALTDADIAKEKAKNEAKRGTVSLTPDAIETYADMFALKGPSALTNLGRGASAQADKSAIINRWSEKQKSLGNTAQDQILREAGRKAGESALSQLEAQEGKIMAFAKFVHKHAKVVEEYAMKVDNTGSPVINRWINAGKKSVAGDKDVTALDFAWKTLTNEYAKLSSSSTGGGVMSQEEAAKFEKLANSALTDEAVKEVLRVMQLDLDNRQAGYNEQKEVIRDAIVGGRQSKPDQQQATTQTLSDDDLLKSLGIPKQRGEHGSRP